jgi:hypothetical protein
MSLLYLHISTGVVARDVDMMDIIALAHVFDSLDKAVPLSEIISGRAHHWHKISLWIQILMVFPILLQMVLNSDQRDRNSWP